jgi:hypothetical protein
MTYNGRAALLFPDFVEIFVADHASGRAGTVTESGLQTVL